MKKYRVSVQLDREFCGACIGVTWPGFTIGMATEDGANALAAELNRLDSLTTELDNSRAVQIEAKNAALKRVAAFEAEQESLIDWFRNQGREYGQLGDSQNWSTQETAFYALEDLMSKNRDLSQLCEKRGEELAKAHKKVTYLGNRLDNQHCDVVVDGVRYTHQSQVDTLTRAQEAKNIADELRLDQADLLNKVGGLELRVRKLVTAIRESQKILADYLAKPPVLSDKRNLRRMKDVITDLLGILDNRDLVTLVKGGAAGDSKKPDGGVPAKPTNWPHWATHLFRDENGWQFGRLIEEKSSRRWVDADKDHATTKLWFEATIVAGTLEERPAEYTVKLATDAQGKTYAAGMGLGNPDDTGIICNNVGEPLRYRNCKTGEESPDPFRKPFIVEADKVYINGAMIRDGKIAVEVGTAVHEILDRLTSVISETQLAPMITTNHFAPEPKASKKELKQLRKATEHFEDYADEEDPLNENVKAAKYLRRLLNKLS